jgi:hypothetical protein
MEASMGRALAFVAVAQVVIAVNVASAQSEMQKFEATIPAQAKFAFAKYQSCALAAQSDNKGASFQEMEVVIGRSCEKELAEADRDLGRAGKSAEQRAMVIRRFSFLAMSERRLTYEGKAIPGYQQDPFVAKIMNCDRKMREAKAVYLTCVNEALKILIPVSNDPSDVVADAALGMCSAKRNDMVMSLMCVSMGAARANAAVAQLDLKLRSSALGAVAAARAAMRQRELMQEQIPKTPQPAQGQKHGI